MYNESMKKLLKKIPANKSKPLIQDKNTSWYFSTTTYKIEAKYKSTR